MPILFSTLAAVERPRVLLAANTFGAVLYVFTASRGGWAIPAERAAGIHSVTGEPLIWFLSILPIVAVLFVINVAWTIVLARNCGRGARFWLLPGVIWLVAIAIDFAHH